MHPKYFDFEMTRAKSKVRPKNDSLRSIYRSIGSFDQQSDRLLLFVFNPKSQGCQARVQRNQEWNRIDLAKDVVEDEKFCLESETVLAHGVMVLGVLLWKQLFINMP